MPRDSTKYHLITALLLNELQRAEQELERQRRELDDLSGLRERVTALEGGERARSPGVR